MTPSDIKADLCNEHGVLQLRMTKFHDDRVSLYVPCVGTFNAYLGTDAVLHNAYSGVSRMFRDEKEARSMASMFAKRMRRHAIKVEVEVIDAEA